MQNNLRDIRQDKSMTLVQLSETSGVSKSSIAEYENDTIEVSLIKAYAIANALKVSVFRIWPNNKGE